MIDWPYPKLTNVSADLLDGIAFDIGFEGNVSAQWCVGNKWFKTTITGR